MKKKSGWKGKKGGKAKKAKMSSMPKKVKEVVESLYPVEIKQATIASTGTTITNTIAVAHLSAIGQGDGYNQRDGNYISPQELSIKGRVYAGTANAYVRVLLIQGNTTSATVPTLAELFEVNTAIINSLMSYYNTDNVYSKLEPKNKPIRVLWDKRFQLYGSGDTGNDKKIQLFSKKIPRSKLKPVNYSGSASTNYMNSGVFLVFFCDQGVNQPTIEYSNTLRFTG